MHEDPNNRCSTIYGRLRQPTASRSNQGQDQYNGESKQLES
jgi:hypothetical protein